jgi:hypothetical protein
MWYRLVRTLSWLSRTLGWHVRFTLRRVRLKPDGTRWRTGGEVKGKLANGVGRQYSHTTSERGVTSITNADAHTSAASSRLNWRPRRFKWTRPFRRKTKSGFCACAITFQTQSNTGTSMVWWAVIHIFRITFKSLVRETGMYGYWSDRITCSCEEAFLAYYMKSTKYGQNYIYFCVVLHFFLEHWKVFCPNFNEWLGPVGTSANIDLPLLSKPSWAQTPVFYPRRAAAIIVLYYNWCYTCDHNGALS